MVIPNSLRNMVIAGKIQPRSRRIRPSTTGSSQAQEHFAVEAGYVVEASAVILTGQRIEFEAVFDRLDKESIFVNRCKGKRFTNGQFISNGTLWRISVANIGPYSDNAARVVPQAVQYFTPEIIMFVGTAGGLDQEDLKYGYVIVVEKAYRVDRGIENPKFTPSRKPQKSHKDIVDLAKKCIERQNWKEGANIKLCENEPEALAGSVGTTEVTVASIDGFTYERIKECFPEVLAVEQEAFGFLEAAKSEKAVKAIVIRGISDFCGEDYQAAGSDERKECAMTNASAFVFELLSKIH